MTTMDEYNQCQEAVRRLHAYLSHELAPDDEMLVQSHLTRCQGCLAKFTFEEALLRTIREKAEAVHAPDTLRDKILNLLHTEES
jgi:anti-sigma factor (TIGR02949 family)